MIESLDITPDNYCKVVAAIIWLPGSSDKLLISKRQKGKHLSGYWELPGGKIDPGESHRQALDRELNEEINIVPVQASWFKRIRHKYEDRNILLDVWQVNSFKGEIRPMEGQEVRWVAVAELANYQFPAADKPIIEAITNNVTVGMEHLP